MIVFEEPEVDTPNFLPCAKCNKPKVVKPGDWCTACASMWPEQHTDYFVVKGGTEADIEEATGVRAKYLQAKQEAAFMRDCVYVVFYAADKWHEVTVHESLYLPEVMANLFKRLEK